MTTVSIDTNFTPSSQPRKGVGEETAPPQFTTFPSTLSAGETGTALQDQLPASSAAAASSTGGGNGNGGGKHHNDKPNDDDGPSGLDPTAERLLISAGSIGEHLRRTRGFEIRWDAGNQVLTRDIKGAFILICFVGWIIWRMMKKSKQAKGGNGGPTLNDILPDRLIARVPFLRQRAWQNLDEDGQVANLPPPSYREKASIVGGASIVGYFPQDKAMFQQQQQQQQQQQSMNMSAMAPQIPNPGLSRSNTIGSQFTFINNGNTLNTMDGGLNLNFNTFNPMNNNNNNNNNNNMGTMNGMNPMNPMNTINAINGMNGMNTINTMNMAAAANSAAFSPHHQTNPSFSSTNTAQFGTMLTVASDSSTDPNGTLRSRMPDAFYNQSELARQPSDAYDPARRQVNRASELSSISSGFGDGDIIISSDSYLMPKMPPTASTNMRQSTNMVGRFSWMSRSGGGGGGPGSNSGRDTIYTQASEDSPPRFRTVTSWVNQQAGRIKRAQQKNGDEEDAPAVPQIPGQLGVPGIHNPPVEQSFNMMMNDDEVPRRVESTLIAASTAAGNTASMTSSVTTSTARAGASS
jgi:hypothetical protein